LPAKHKPDSHVFAVIQHLLSASHGLFFKVIILCQTHGDDTKKVLPSIGKPPSKAANLVKKPGLPLAALLASVQQPPELLVVSAP